jgi:membrane protein
VQPIWQLLKATVSEWQFNQVSLLAAALAYHTVFSIAPLMVLVIMLVGLVFGESAAQGELVQQLEQVVGPEAAQVIETAIASLREDQSGDTIQFIVSLGFVAFGAINVFLQIQGALNKIWHVKPRPRQNLFRFLRKRLLTFAMVLVIAFLLVVSFISNTVMGTLVNLLSDALPDFFPVWRLLSFSISLVMLTLLFAAIYTLLPDAKVTWKDALVGSTLTTVLFVIGQFLFGQVLSRTEFGSAYGIAGSFVILITWIYYAAHIFFLGAEFTEVYAERLGTPIVPEPHAVSIKQEAEVHQY